MRRVVVTGLGVVSALGMSRAEHFEGLREGRSGVRELDIPDVDRLSIRIGATQPRYKGAERFDRTQLALYDRTTQMALTAAAEAMEDAGIEVDEALGLRTAVITGTALNGMETIDDNYRTVFEKGKNRVHPFIVPRLMTSAPASQISMAYGLRGPAYTITTACSSSNHAIGQAFHLIRSGVVDAAVTGGAEAPLTFGVMKAWEGLRVMSKDGCRPFAKNRNGMVQGEGAAILVLEEYERARARGAAIWGEMVGFGMSADAADIVQPAVDGATRAIRAALEDAGSNPDAVGYVNAHGTATAANDRTEAAALADVFGGSDRVPPVSSTKSMHGHCIGGAGAVEMAAVLMALTEGVIPPTINHDQPDPDIPLDVVPNAAREAAVDVALSDSFAFGGLNAVLVARKV